jgi:hypothetical protein
MGGSLLMRESRFTFLCNEDERRLIAALSERLARTQSDAVRWLIREAARELEHETGRTTRTMEPVA